MPKGHTRIGVRDIAYVNHVDAVIDPKQDVEAAINYEMAHKVVEDAINALPEWHHRTIARLCILRNYTDAQVARMAWLDIKFVARTREEAVAQLRKKLKPILLS